MKTWLARSTPQSSADFHSAVSQASSLRPARGHEPLPIGNRRYSRFGNLRYRFLPGALAAMFLVATSAFAQDKPDLTGKVIDSGLNPVKNATVFIYTAG